MAAEWLMALLRITPSKASLEIKESKQVSGAGFEHRREAVFWWAYNEVRFAQSSLSR